MSYQRINTQINLELTQESGQTSQPPWRHSTIENMKKFNELIYLKVPSFIEVLDDKSINFSRLPILLELSQEKTDLNGFEYLYKLPQKIEKVPFSIWNGPSNDNLSENELNLIGKEAESELNRIYDLSFDLEGFYNFLLDDDRLAPSVEFCKGLRLFIAKDPFECIISSICSANNSIARWTKSMDMIKHNWGEKVEFDCGTFYGFPSPKQFLDFHETPMEEADADGHSFEIDCYRKNLKACGVGYRAPYMKKASEILENELDIDEIFDMAYDEAFECVLALPGVGPKVADCILLYGFGFKEAFPSDVWIKRIVSHLYFDGEDISADKTREFGIERFGDYAGYAQLYLFHYARKSGLMDKIKNK